MKVIILAGGGGTRLYPLSTPQKPKQFLPLANARPLLIDTIERFVGLAGIENIVVVTGKKFEDETLAILKEYGLYKVNTVFEPCPRNTAPAIILGTVYCLEKLNAGNQEPIFVAPSDHVIKPQAVYETLVREACAEAEKGRIVTLGIKPDGPETGFGYIRAENSEKLVNRVLEFKEKPDYETALKYVASGEYFWNAGMFAFTSETLLRELKNTSVSLADLYSGGYENILNNFNDAEKISIDYAVAEKSDNVSVVKSDILWSDLGSWDAFYDFCVKDKDGNAVFGDVKAVDCRNCLIFCDEGHIGVAQLENMLIIKANGNTVVMPRGTSQIVRSIAD